MKKFFALFVLGLVSANVYASDVQINAAWARATAPGQNSAAVAMHIVSQKEGNIVAVSSDAAASAEIHSMVHENGMMKMRALEKLPLPAKQEISLGEDGHHLMLIGLKKPLSAGDSIPLNVTVRFANKQEEIVNVIATVKPLTTPSGSHHHHH